MLKDQQIDLNQSYIDKSRIGIFGWSFGGYMTSLALTKGADVFKMGIVGFSFFQNTCSSFIPFWVCGYTQKQRILTIYTKTTICISTI